MVGLDIERLRAGVRLASCSVTPRLAFPAASGTAVSACTVECWNAPGIGPPFDEVRGAVAMALRQKTYVTALRQYPNQAGRPKSSAWISMRPIRRLFNEESIRAVSLQKGGAGMKEELIARTVTKRPATGAGCCMWSPIPRADEGPWRAWRRLRVRRCRFRRKRGLPCRHHAAGLAEKPSESERSSRLRLCIGDCDFIPANQVQRVCRDRRAFVSLG